MAAKSVIGLDIGATHIRAVEVSDPGKRRPTLQRYGRLALAPGIVRDGMVIDQASLAAALRMLWGKARFSTKQAVLGIGNKRVLVRDLTLPEMPLSAVKEALPFHVSESLPVSVNDALLDFYPIRELTSMPERGIQGLLVAAIRESVKANVDAVRLAGLQPSGVDLIPFALSRALARGEYSKQTVAMIDIGAHTTNVVISSRAVPQFVRIVPTGGQEVTQALVSTLELPEHEAEQLKRQVGIVRTDRPEHKGVLDTVFGVIQPQLVGLRDTLSYYNQQHASDPLRAVLLSGGASRLPGFKEGLYEALRIPVLLADPAHDMNLGRKLDSSALGEDRHEATVALGLAMGEHDG